MNTKELKTAIVFSPWEDTVRVISFKSSERSAVDEVLSLIQDKGMEIYSVKGFSVDEICFLSSYLSKKESMSCWD